MAESVLEKLIKIDLDPQLLENYRVDPAEELAKMEQQIAVPRFEPMDISKSTWRVWSAWVSVWKTSNPI